MCGSFAKKLNGDSIPNADHVLRHVKGRFIQNGEIDGSAFRLREGESHLSFNWMEFDFYRSRTVEEQVQLIRENFPLKLASKDQFPSLNVDAVKHHVSSEHTAGKVIDFVEDGDETNPSHCI